MITFITYHDGTEPFKEMSFDLFQSIFLGSYGRCEVVEIKPNGGSILAEGYCAMYPVFSQAITKGPVVFLDADCIVQKPIDHLFEKDFAIAAIHRGKCSNSQGQQDYLGCFVGFHPGKPNLVRALWLNWMDRIYPYMIGPLVDSAVKRHEDMKKRGWHPAWYAGQSAYNDMLFNCEEVGIPILRLDRKEYAARPGDKDAYVIHHKGHGKVK